MPKAPWILQVGRSTPAAVAAGHNLMEAAVANNVPDVIGECGGCLSCATCHVYVDPAWYEKAGGPGDMEGEMLEITTAERPAMSRLSCKITASEDLDGIVLHVPHI